MQDDSVTVRMLDVRIFNSSTVDDFVLPAPWRLKLGYEGWSYPFNLSPTHWASFITTHDFPGAVCAHADVGTG